MRRLHGIVHGTMIARHLIYLILVFTLVAFTGCARTFVKEYVEADSSYASDKLGRYDLEIVFRAMKIKDTKGVDDFRLYVIATHEEVIENPDALQLFPEIAIDSLCIVIPAWDSTVCPELLSIDQLVPGRDETVDKGHYRVTYRYRLMRLPDEVSDIRMVYVAKLFSRKDGSLEQRQEFSHNLSRNERDQIYRY